MVSELSKTVGSLQEREPRQKAVVHLYLSRSCCRSHAVCLCEYPRGRINRGPFHDNSVADLDEVIRSLNAEPEFRRQRSDVSAKLEAAERTLKRSQSLYDSLYQNYVEHLMTEHEYVTLKARYKAETEDAERMIAALEQEQRESKVYTSENRFLTEFRSFMGTDKLTKEMASALVERIYVDADKNIDIRLRYRDEYMALLKFIEGRTVV